jgi:hypothetical protein
MKTFQILWDDFNSRNNFEKRVARPFNYVCIQMVIECASTNLFILGSNNFSF